MAYDPRNGLAVLFGGGAYVSFDDTWLWDGSRWEEAHPAHRPPARENATMAYDEQREQLLLFGGDSDDAVISPTPLADTWSWDRTDWVRLEPAAVPPAAHTPHMAYDPTTREMVLVVQSGFVPPFHPDKDPSRTETWTWDGSNWTRRSTRRQPVSEGSPFSGALGQAPGSPIHHGWGPKGLTTAMATDPGNGHVMLVQRPQYQAEELGPAATWAWIGDDWQLSPVRDAPTPPPNSPMLAADTVARRVLYLDASGSLWGWDGAVWTGVGIAPPALQRGASGLVFDAKGQVVVFGGIGLHPGGLYGDTWTWSPNRDWSLVGGEPEPVAVTNPIATAPAVGISEDEAMQRAVAWNHGAQAAVRVMAGPARDFWRPGSWRPGGARYVWAVLLTGVFHAPSGGPFRRGQPDRPPAPATTALVVLDYATGEFLVAEHPAPPQLL